MRRRQGVKEDVEQAERMAKASRAAIDETKSIGDGKPVAVRRQSMREKLTKDCRNKLGHLAAMRRGLLQKMVIEESD